MKTIRTRHVTSYADELGRRIRNSSGYVEKLEKKPLVRIGRNDLCPCGNGKKYKKCCYLKQLQAVINA